MSTTENAREHVRILTEADAWDDSLITHPDTGEVIRWGDAPPEVRTEVAVQVAHLVEAQLDAAAAITAAQEASERSTRAAAHLRRVLVRDNPILGVTRDTPKPPNRRVDTTEIDRNAERLPLEVLPTDQPCKACDGTGKVKGYLGVRDLDKHKDAIQRAGVPFDRIVTRPVVEEPDKIRWLGAA